MFPQGFFWYEKKRFGPGCPPKWINKRLKHAENTLKIATTGIEMSITPSTNENQEENETGPRKTGKTKQSK